MRDFPPTITAWAGPGTSGVPDTRGPGRFLWWLVRQQPDLVVAACLCSLLWMLPTALTPWVFGRAIDEGIVAQDGSRIALWCLVLLAITLVGGGSGVFYHTVVVRSWLVASYGQTGLVTNKTARLGHVLTRRAPTGEVLSVSGSDGEQFGHFVEILSRLVGNVVAYLLVAVIVLQISVPLGLVVLLVAPLLVVVSSVLLRPLSAAQTRERSRDSELTSMATDIVAGLRILRGIGGERIFGTNYARQSQRVRAAGVQAGAWAALVEAVGVLLSGLFVVALLVLGVRAVGRGELAIGQLVTFLGYALFLVQPIRVVFEAAQQITRSFVSARKTIGVLGTPDPWPERERVAVDVTAELVDEASGLRVRPGRLTMVVSALPDDSAALADRLGRYLPADDALSGDDDDEASGGAARRARREREAARAALAERDTERARRPWGVRIGDVDLSALPLDQVRETVLVSDTRAHVFAGTLQDSVDPHGTLTREQAEAALHAAAAEDVYDILPGGWQGVLDERGRGLSGGQRQRLVLARALAADPPVLVLVEPTSAVDAHTEARIAARLPEHRRGRTTVVMTASPLLLHHADEVALLEHGVVVATGTHDELVSTCEAYRRTVLRGERAEALDPAPSGEVPDQPTPTDPAQHELPTHLPEEVTSP
ncbi:ABC transporter ATP-binding protein [Ornithinimicrobium humiphilum]|uniref:ABC-type multidrug transport system fused ATPase/permease subunit n=1 Tax=Ornithinimicrobium humiphilum TaxID=125288 RepID=A0A543KQM9_9MICO|nr:ABC transporter ATP-binding protein [Ornithinimicrobium humiphilum]TQM97382.1 ABC-type multidrug transport system fused ATPase/permease subunit [Ornithinimicrobium humiphilum]